MSVPLRVLLLEDVPTDAQLIERQLVGAGWDVTLHCVDGADAFRAALEEFRPELILADYNLPGFDGLSALREVRARDLRIPFIIVSGVIGEDQAVDTLKAGATDYVSKDRLSRLGPVVERALREVAEHDERVEAERALRASEERFRTVFETAASVIMVLDADGTITACNRRVEAMLGRPARDLVGVSMLSLLPPEDRPAAAACLDEVHRCGFVYDREFRMLRADGTAVFVNVNSSVMRSAAERPGTLCIINDITTRKRAEDALRLSEQRYRDLVENINDVVFMMDTAGVFLYVSPAIRAVSGHDPQDLVGRHAGEVVHPDDAAVLQRRMESVLRGELRRFSDMRFLTRDGTVRWIRVSARPLLRDGLAVAIQGTFHDVTELKQAEQERERLQGQLLQSDRMAALGTLAAGVAHEFNNLLQIMVGYVELARRSDAMRDLRKVLDIVMETSERASALIRSLLTFSRQGTREREPHRIARIVETVAGMLEAELRKYRITIVKHLDPSAEAPVNQTEMLQVFLNLFINARDAMTPDGGVITVDVCRAGGAVQVRVSDTGAGIPPEHLPRIFDPFFTTKGPLGGSSIPGTGLGLFVTYGIVQHHGGTIAVESVQGKGTTFTITLPASVDEGGTGRNGATTQLPETAGRGSPGASGTARALVVDDEESIGDLVRRVLESEGWTVTVCTDGDRALRAAAAASYDIALVDMVMPGLSGVQVIARLRAMHPALRVVVMTGRLADDTLTGELQALQVDGVLQKPFTVAELRRFIPGRRRTRRPRRR
jgi:two-component system cell cycle sensor histidine kinase/response regulator CckA